MKLTVSTKVYAPLERVRNCMRNPEHIVKRAFADEATRHCPWAKGSEPKVGETFTTRMEARDGSFGFDLVGQYTQVSQMEHFSYIMGSYERDADFVPAGRMVDVTFDVLPSEGLNSNEERGGGEVGGYVLVTEIFDAEELHSSEQQIAGWQAILDNFKKACEQQ